VAKVAASTYPPLSSARAALLAAAAALLFLSDIIDPSLW
jgi:hypothetical protein